MPQSAKHQTQSATSPTWQPAAAKWPNSWYLPPKTAYMSATGKLRTATGGKVSRDHQRGGHRKQNEPGNGDRNGAEGNVLISGTRVRSEYYRANIEALKRFAKENGGRFFWLLAKRDEILAPDIFYGASSGCRVYSKRLGVSSLVYRPRSVQNPTTDSDWS